MGPYRPRRRCSPWWLSLQNRSVCRVESSQRKNWIHILFMYSFELCSHRRRRPMSYAKRMASVATKSALPYKLLSNINIFHKNFVEELVISHNLDCSWRYTPVIMVCLRKMICISKHQPLYRFCVCYLLSIYASFVKLINELYSSQKHELFVLDVELQQVQ